MNEFGAILLRLRDSTSYPLALATLIRVSGSSYRRSGARLLVTQDGSRLGSISGGCLEEDLLARIAKGPPTPGVPEVVTYDTTSENDLVWGVGLGCHGIVHVVVEWLEAQPAWIDPVYARWTQRETVPLWVDAQGTRLPHPDGRPPEADVFINYILPPLALTVCGAGDDAQPLVRLAAALGWTVTVLDPRPALATRARFPEAFAVASAPLDELTKRGQWDHRTAAVIMTHHYHFDRPLLAALLPLELPYLGLLGPRRRAEKILADLASSGNGSPRSDTVKLHAPIGLDLGGDGPEAVALAILAEIQAAFHQRDARPLRHRADAIHAS